MRLRLEGLLIIPALISALTIGCASAQPSEPDPIPFIDAHVHLNDERMQLELMQRHGVERAVVFWGRNSDNDTVAASAKRHPGRFLPFASVSPERAAYRRGWEQDDPTLLATLDTMLATGLYLGIGEISVTHFPSPGLPEADFNPNGATLRGILLLARKHRLPVMVHAEWTRLREFGGLLRSFPDVPVIWAHGGYTPLFIAQRMLDQHPNLIYELSARTWPVHPRSPDYTILRDGQNVWPQWLAFIESRPERFLVGTDASHRSVESESMKFQSVQNFLRQLSPATRDLVARGNMLQLLRLPP